MGKSDAEKRKRSREAKGREASHPIGEPTIFGEEMKGLGQLI